MSRAAPKKPKKRPPTGRLLFEPIKAQSRFARSVIVAFSGGKDSVVTLDLCCRYFDEVHVFFMYQVPGLSFQEAAIRWAENRYGIEVMRLPHFELSDWFRLGVFRHEDWAVPPVGIQDIYAYVRQQTGAHFIAAGERIADSIWRRAMMKHSGHLDVKRGRFYPLMYFRQPDVMAYIKQRDLKVSPESRFLGHSFRSLQGDDMFLLRRHYPADYEKVARWFPFVGAGVRQFEMEMEENGREF
ncbi:MAG: phosphoadenosine phosphosulfate reductase family protein [Dechloromonas sp.]|nr:phosphoadenosine phosphosulfate reductase family protein [Dechloromonas sp.]